jgi:opacity protein-like surface antigen
VGATFETRLHKFIWLQTDLLYVRRYQKDVYYKASGAESLDHIALDYIALPVGVKFDLDLEHIKLYGVLGVQLAYGMQVEVLFAPEAVPLNGQNLAFEEVGLRSWDAGLSLASGFEKMINNRYKLFLEYRYYLGITSLNSMHPVELFNEGGVLNIGIRFRL